MSDNRRCITLKAFFSKEVINSVTGERLGYIDDAEIDAESGTIRFFCATQPCKNLLSKKKTVKKFAYSDIVKIGDDIILIKSCFCVVNPKKSVVKG